MDLVIERRTVSGNSVLDERLHPVLRRAYAARGVLEAAELSLTLDRLAPVSTLESVDAAVALIANDASSSSAISMPMARRARL
jgi:hypothetical protein